jgi:ubiquinone/menaquinone biosynthesis C-methylase UbiE
MAETSRHDAWQAGDSYDLYMGRWSRRIAPLFLDWLDAEAGLDWLDVGCGTGALSAAIMARCQPAQLTGIDPSEGFIQKARANVAAPAAFQVGDAQALDVPSGATDVVVSGLMLNFVPDRERALSEMKRVAKRQGLVAFYVWDYPGGGVEFMRAFWTAAVALDPAARDLTEDKRFPFCTPDQLADLATKAGLPAVEQTALETPAVFRDFDDFWHPFTLGAGPAPGYCASLSEDARQRLKEKLQQQLQPDKDGSIALKLRAWGIKSRAG